MYDGIVYAGSTDKTLYAIDALSGSLVWTATTGGYIYTAPAVTDNLVYIGSSDGVIHAFNALTGAAVWTYTTSAGVYATGLAIANGVVYVGSYDERFYGLDADNGTLLWTFATGAYIRTAPSIVNGDLYGTSNDGDLYSFTLAAGTDPSR